jgi:metal-responsive CopG/Arc/MetJ family transcriptional regulator
MKAVQIVVDSELLGRLDKAARRRHLSRSAFVRQALESVLGAEHMQELVDAERRGYAAKPTTADEERSTRALVKAQQVILAQLASEDPW